MGKESSRPKKVLLLGAKGFDFGEPDVLVRCVPWEDIKSAPNASDFDVVVLSLLFENYRARDAVQWWLFVERFTVSTALDIIGGGGQIVVVGDPRFATVGGSLFLAWTGQAFFWDNASGDTLVIEDTASSIKLRPYLTKIKRWHYSLDHMVRNNADGLSGSVEALCKNRSKRVVAFKVNYSIEDVWLAGSVLCLPRIDTSDEEALQMVLRDVCYVEVHLPEPEWAKNLAAPGQKAIDGEVGRMEAQIETLSANLQKAREERETARQCLKLLYERQFALEPIVRETLRSLGATVEESEDSTKSDGWLTVTVGDRTLEYGIKQLVDWVTLGVHEREKRGKGLFIGVASLNEPPDKRKDPFPQNWVSKLKLHEFAAIRTEDLYAAYVADRQGRLDRNRFWTALHDTNGVVGAEGFGIVETPRP